MHQGTGSEQPASMRDVSSGHTSVQLVTDSKGMSGIALQSSSTLSEGGLCKLRLLG